MALYEIRHQIEGVEGKLLGTVVHDTTDDLLTATVAAELLTRQGRGGSVRRTADGAVLAPGGKWLDEEGQEIPTHGGIWKAPAEYFDLPSTAGVTCYLYEIEGRLWTSLFGGQYAMTVLEARAEGWTRDQRIAVEVETAEPREALEVTTQTGETVEVRVVPATRREAEEEAGRRRTARIRERLAPFYAMLLILFLPLVAQGASAPKAVCSAGNECDLILRAWDLCIDSMHAAAEREIGKPGACERVRFEDGTTAWVKPTKGGGWSRAACEPQITYEFKAGKPAAKDTGLPHTEGRLVSLRKVTGHTCSVWIYEGGAR